MSEAAVDIVERMIAAFNLRDVEAFTACTSGADFEWRPSMSPVDGAVFAGAVGIRQYFDEMRGSWERFQIFPASYHEREGVVLMLGRLEGRGLASGATVDSELGMAFGVRDGLITRVESFLDHDRALEATGFSR